MLTTLLLSLPSLAAAPLPDDTCAAGFSSALMGIGTSSVSADLLRLSVQTVLDFAPGLYVYGPDAGAVPLGNGTLCVGLNGLVRGPISEAFVNTLDLEFRASAPASGQPAITAGMTLRFQAWFRDAGDPTGFGLSDALRVTFTP